MPHHHEAARTTPLVESVDVVVAGGGPAGIAAALAAARSGAKVRLLETQGCLGGIWTAGLLGWILDDTNKPGLVRELLDRLAAHGERQDKNNTGGTACDPEALKWHLEAMMAEAGVEVRLHTRIVGAARDAQNRMRIALTESKSGREAWEAKAFIDCTGDGDLAAQAGCGFDYGREHDGAFQPMSLIAMLTGIEYAGIRDAVHGSGAHHRSGTRHLLDLLEAKGLQCSYAAPILMRVHDNLFLMMANHEYQKSGLDAQAITDATIAARSEVRAIIAALRSHGGPWANLRLAATGAQIGVREGRRIYGRYTVSDQDLIDGARHADAVCRCTFGVDVHAPDPTKSKGFDHGSIKAKPYDIPLRACIARDCDALLLAGRCISGSFTAHSSYRVTGNAVALGEAAGCCAGIAVTSKRLPHEVPFAEVHAALATAWERHEAIDRSRPDQN
jgi:hypothetical protein